MIEDAVNVGLEILNKLKQIKSLQDTLLKEVSLYQMKHPQFVKCDLDKIDASIESNEHIGHKVCFKDFKLNLYTDGDADKIPHSIFECLIKELKECEINLNF